MIVPGETIAVTDAFALAGPPGDPRRAIGQEVTADLIVGGALRPHGKVRRWLRLPPKRETVRVKILSRTEVVVLGPSSM